MNVLRASIDRQTIMPTGTRTVPEPELVRRVKAQYISQLKLVAVLVFASLVIIKGISKGEFSYNTDETQHAVTGMYVADLVRDRPFSNPIEYTYQYYAHYPEIGRA